MKALILLGVAAMLPLAPLSAHAISTKFAAMSEPARNDLFKRYLEKAGKTCSKVTRVAFKGTAGAEDIWNVQCETGWSIRIASNGSTRVSDCAVAAAKGLQCWVPIPSRVSK